MDKASYPVLAHLLSFPGGNGTVLLLLLQAPRILQPPSRCHQPHHGAITPYQASLPWPQCLHGPALSRAQVEGLDCCTRRHQSPRPSPNHSGAAQFIQALPVLQTTPCKDALGGMNWKTSTAKCIQQKHGKVMVKGRAEAAHTSDTDFQMCPEHTNEKKNSFCFRK